MSSFSHDFLLAVRRGHVKGHSFVPKFGRNDAVANAAWEFVTGLNEDPHAPAATATTVRVKAGGNAADDAAGNGAREVTVEGLDENWALATEAKATAGASASASTTTTFMRVFRAWVSSQGVYGAANTAAITVENTAGTADLISIATEEGQSQFCAYTIPASKTGHVLGIWANVDAQANKAANLRVFSRDDADDATAPLQAKRIKYHADGVVGQHRYQPESPAFVFDEKTDLWIEAFGDGAITQVSAGMEILLIDDDAPRVFPG